MMHGGVPQWTLGFLLGVTACWAGTRSIPLEANAWSSEDATIVFEDHLGRRAMRLTGGEATMKGVKLRDGVIEFDVAFEETRGFSGVIFRRPDGRDGENFYLRAHQSGNPDANQYTPIFNGLPAW